MVEHWAWAELTGAQVGDRRRVRSLVRICAKLEENAGVSLSAACGPALRQAAHRIFSHPDLKPMNLLAGHVQETACRCAAHPLVLVAQDSTEFSYTTHPATTGLGPIRVPGTQGFFGHAALALTPAGEPLGLLHARYWSRDPAEYGKKHRRHALPTGAKESQKWVEGLAAVEAALPPEVCVLVIQDREGDTFPLMATPRRPNTHLLIRAYEPRRAAVLPAHPAETTPALPSEPPDRDVRLEPAEGSLEATPEPHVLALASAAPVVGVLTVTVPRQTGKPERPAHLTVRASQLQIERPRVIRRAEGLARQATLWVIRATEEQPPPETDAIDWVLLTSWPVLSGETACQLVGYYARRWSIERLHWVLKTGLRVERLQLDDAASLQNALAIYSLVAWRLLLLTYVARTQPEAAAAAFLSPAEQVVLEHRAGRRLETIRQAVEVIAQLGGWESYRQGPEPGPKSLWQGLRRLGALVEGWQLALDALRRGMLEL